MNGFILVNKETGISSNRVVQEIKKKIKADKVGHLGTLDPLADGLLVLAINRATKFSNYFLESDKSYDVEVMLGINTDTDDSTGKIISVSKKIPSKEEVKAKLFRFMGDSMQTPPFFSALKHKGKPLYKYARQGEFISKPPRKIRIKDISNFKYKDRICSFEIDCSKGTYIRSIARDLGKNLGCGAHMKSLTRLSQADFNLSEANNISDITNRNIISIETTFKKFNKISINSDESKRFINGVKIPKSNSSNTFFRVFNEKDNFLGIGEIKNNNLKHKQLV
tara:strand:+ start:5317 stop:6156 length:840 start_codon:yes stop_codon:yes gene_type:complete